MSHSRPERRPIQFKAGLHTSDMRLILDLVRLRVAQIRECEVGTLCHASRLGLDRNSSIQAENLDSWPVISVFDDRKRVALAMAEILARPLPEESTLLPHLFQHAQKYLTRGEIVEIVVAVEAMQEWEEDQIHV